MPSKKDYTINCSCGAELYVETLKEAKADALNHSKVCDDKSAFPEAQIFIDESEDGELNDVYYTLEKGKFKRHS